MTPMLPKFGIETTMVSFMGTEDIRKMMSFLVHEDTAKIDDFMSGLHLSRYAMTLAALNLL